MAHGSVLYVPRCPLFVRSMKTVCCCWVCESGRRGQGEGRRCRKLGQRPPPWPWRFGIVCLTSSVFLFLSTADCGRLSPSQARTPDVKHPVHLPDCPRPPHHCPCPLHHCPRSASTTHGAVCRHVWVSGGGRRYRVSQVALRADELRLWESAMERRLLRSLLYDDNIRCTTPTHTHTHGSHTSTHTHTEHIPCLLLLVDV